VRAARTIAVLVVVAGLLGNAVSAGGEVVQKGGVRVAFEGEISPTALPRKGTAPIAVSIGGDISAGRRGTPPQLRRIEIAINSNGRIDPAGLPTCRLDQIQPSTTAKAMAACGGAKVGEGKFLANVIIPQQSPFPSRGEVTVFNGREAGRPVMFAHVYGADPVPTSYTLPLRIEKTKGTFGTVLSADLPEVTSDVAFVTGIELRLERVFRHRGKRRGYVSAGCPAPRGFPSAIFPLARASFGFAGGLKLGATLVRSCRAKGG
jgi:hypothetical protein